MHNLAMSTQRGHLEVGVSAREAEVLTAVAEHLTNGEAALAALGATSMVWPL